MFVIIVEKLTGCQSLVENDGLVLNAVRGKREGVSVFSLTLQTALSVLVQSTTAVGFAMDKAPEPGQPPVLQSADVSNFAPWTQAAGCLGFVSLYSVGPLSNAQGPVSVAVGNAN